MPYKGISDFLSSQLELYSDKYRTDPRIIDTFKALVDDIKNLHSIAEVILFNRDSGIFSLRREDQERYDNLIQNLSIPLGINTQNPIFNVQYVGPNGGYPAAFVIDVSSDNANDSALISARRGRGRSENPQIVLDDDLVLYINGYARNTTTTFPAFYREIAFIKFLVDDIPAARVAGRIEFGTTAAGVLVPVIRLTIVNSGHLQIPELTVPPTPPANNVYFYSKDDGGISSLFFMDDAGIEHNLGNQSFADGSITLVSGKYMHIIKELVLAGTERLTMEGTSRLLITD